MVRKGHCDGKEGHKKDDGWSQTKLCNERYPPGRREDRNQTLTRGKVGGKKKRNSPQAVMLTCSPNKYRETAQEAKAGISLDALGFFFFLGEENLEYPSATIPGEIIPL